jgi:hypothetical protein
VAARAQTVQFNLLPDTQVRARLDLVTRGSQERYQVLSQLFGESGCPADQLVSQAVKHAKTPNIICSLPGESSDIILVTAHYDMEGPGLGLIDNWTGATMLANLYSSLSKIPRRHTIRFIGFTDEEKGLVGSRAFVSQARKEGLAPIKAVINMDSIGTGPISVWASRGDARLLSALLQVRNAMNLDISWTNVDNVGDTDTHAFVEKKIPTVDFHSLTTETFPILHSKQDTIEALNFGHYQRTYHALSAYVAFLDLALEEILARKIKR